MTDDEKNELLAKLISTETGRQQILQIAKETNSMDKLGEAIITSIKLIGDAYKAKDE
jgi:hypothetical protein